MIYYVDTAANVLGGTNSNDLDGITALQSAAYAVFIDDATVNSVTNNGTAQGTLSIASLTPNGTNRYGIPTATGTLTFTATPAATLLANAQQAKIASLGASLANDCSTFTSTALGTTHTYLSGESDMVKLAGEYAYVKGSDYKSENIMWWTQENGRVSHTGAQFIQVYLDARSNVANQYAHYDSLVSQVNAATTVSAVDAITW